MTRPSSSAASASSGSPISALRRVDRSRVRRETACRSRVRPLRHRVGGRNCAALRVMVGERAVVALELVLHHVGAVDGEQDLGQHAGKAGAVLDQRHQRARGHVDPLQHPLPVLQDLVREPVVGVGRAAGLRAPGPAPGRPGCGTTSSPISRSLRRRCRIASSSSRASRSRPELGRPGPRPSSMSAGGVAVGPRERDRGLARGAVDLDLDQLE